MVSIGLEEVSCDFGAARLSAVSDGIESGGGGEGEVWGGGH